MVWPIPRDVGNDMLYYDTLDVINKGFDGPNFNIKGYGAPGGGADSTAAIQGTINAAAGKGRVTGPPDLYVVSSTITIPSNSDLFWPEGTVFQCAPGFTGTPFAGVGNAATGVSNVRWQGGEIDGNKANRGGATGNLLHFTTAGDGSNNNNIRIIDLYAHDSPMLGIVVSRCRRGRVVLCHAAYNERDGITFYFDCQHLLIAFNDVHDCKDDLIGLNAENGTSTGHVMSHLRVIGNDLYNQTSQGSGLAIRGVVHSLLAKNIIDSAFASGMEVSNFNTTWADDLDLVDNIIRLAGASNSGGAGFGITVVGAGTNVSNAGVAGCRNIRIKGGSITTPRIYGVRLLTGDPVNAKVQKVSISGALHVDMTGTPNTSGVGIVAPAGGGVEDVTIDGAVVWNAPLQGILLTSVIRPELANCRANDNGQAVGTGSSSSNGIRLISCVDSKLINNTGIDTQGSPTQRNGIRIDTCTGSMIITGNGTAGNGGGLGLSLNDTTGLSYLRVRDNPNFNPWTGQVSIASGGWTGPTLIGGINYYNKTAVLTYAVAFPAGQNPSAMLTCNATGVEVVAQSPSNTGCTINVVSQRSDGPAVIVYYTIEPNV